MSESTEILKYLEVNGTITCVQAIHEISCYNLRSRASELGLASTMIPIIRKDGRRVHVARYSMS